MNTLSAALTEARRVCRAMREAHIVIAQRDGDRMRYAVRPASEAAMVTDASIAATVLPDGQAVYGHPYWQARRHLEDGS